MNVLSKFVMHIQNMTEKLYNNVLTNLKIVMNYIYQIYHQYSLLMI